MKIFNQLSGLLIFVLIISSCGVSKKKSIVAVNLRCENLEDPMAIDIANPLLSWNMQATKRGQSQSAYRILVAKSEENLQNNIGDCWDTGETKSDVSVNIKYAGMPLKSRDALYWKVKIWNAEGEESDWSAASKWEMSFLEPKDWQAKWIGLAEDENPLSTKTSAAPYFRHEIDSTEKIKSAKVYVSGLGYYELYLNASKVGDEVLAPAQTNYTKGCCQSLYHYDDQSTTRVFYNTFDVTNLREKGKIPLE
ncbi:MAG: alpha-L-rhamnosidase N-terminal domain-containing protein [Draconibacterium sp.]